MVALQQLMLHRGQKTPSVCRFYHTTQKILYLRANNAGLRVDSRGVAALNACGRGAVRTYIHCDFRKVGPVWLCRKAHAGAARALGLRGAPFFERIPQNPLGKVIDRTGHC
jgi:hypothetical protein